jgi:hypothetical protein
MVGCVCAALVRPPWGSGGGWRLQAISGVGVRVEKRGFWRDSPVVEPDAMAAAGQDHHSGGDQRQEVDPPI